MKEKAKVLDKDGINRALMRIAHEILEKNKGTQGICLIGIRNRGSTTPRSSSAIRASIQPRSSASATSSTSCASSGSTTSSTGSRGPRRRKTPASCRAISAAARR